MKKIYLFAVIFALIAGFATYFFVNSLQHNSAITGVEEADVVVALEDIEKDTIVTPAMFKVIRLPVTSITYGTLVNANEVNGFLATEKICKGEQVLASKLTDLREGDSGLEYNGEYRLSYHLTEGKYAYTISVPETNSMGSFIRAGDYIDIYSTAGITDKNPVLKNIHVLHIGNYSDLKSGLETTTYSLLTLEVTEKQIGTLIAVGDSIHIVMVPYAQGAALTTMTTEPVTDENGNVVRNGFLKEPQTNYGMGEVQTDPPSTTSAK